jgi:hypothetical protein
MASTFTGMSSLGCVFWNGYVFTWMVGYGTMYGVLDALCINLEWVIMFKQVV